MLAVASRTCAPPHCTRECMEHHAGHLCTQREITWLAAQDSDLDWDEEDAVEAACTDAAWQASPPAHYAPDSDTGGPPGAMSDDGRHSAQSLCRAGGQDGLLNG